MTRELTRAQMLDSVVEQLRADGYDVLVDPSDRLLPKAFGGTRPDAIALGKLTKIAVIIQRNDGRASDGRLDRLQSGILSLPDWTLRVLSYSTDDSFEPLQLTSPQVVRREVENVRKLSASGFQAPALLMAWATFEAVCRMVMPDAFERPQSPGRLVERMAYEGHITPSEADFVRALVPVRNRLIHGVLETHVDQKDVGRFADVIVQVMGEALAPAAE